MVDALTAWSIFATAWGISAGPVGYWIRARQDRRNALPNIRPRYRISSKGYACIIEVHARTSEDICITSVKAGGQVSIGKPEAVYDPAGGKVTGFSYNWVNSPAKVHWLVPAGETRSFDLTVDGVDDLSIEMTLDSSARTLRRKSAIIHPPINE